MGAFFLHELDERMTGVFHRHRDAPNRACYSDTANVRSWHITDINLMDGDFRFRG